MYETLLHEAAEERIEVISRPFNGKLKGIYSNQIIAINSNIDSAAEKACIMAEELGHYHMTVGNILDQTIISNRKQEHLARAWSYRRLVPLDKLILAYKTGIRTQHELAEHLNITEHFLTAALQHYIIKHGIYCRVDKYWICFDPLGIIENFKFRHQEIKPANDEAGFVLE